MVTTIAEKANDIRSKTYGKDVREALASGLEKINDVAETSNNTANKAKTIAVSVTAAENQRIENENVRKKNEETRVSNETSRVRNEKDRVLNEDERIKKENTRVENEKSRVISEDKRLLNEKERQGKEALRVSNENTRIQVEKQRESNENIRISKENERVKNEQGRVVSENNRQSSERNRAVAEEERAKTWKIIKDSYMSDETNGDMKKVVYDKNNDGVVDLAEKCISSYTKGEVDKLLTNKVNSVQGKQLSTEDYTTIEKQKLAGIATGANNYVHPSAHVPSVITQDANHRFVTDTEKNNWNSKASGNHTHSEGDLINIIQSLEPNGYRVFPGGLKIVKGSYKTPAGGSDGNNYGVFHKIISKLKLPITFDNKDSMRVFANSNSTWAWSNGSASSNSGINLFVSNVSSAQANVGIVIDYFVIGN